MKRTKSEIQFEALNLSEFHSYLVLEHATGLGKSLAAINIIEKYGGNWNIVLAETNHELNWIEEFKEHNKQHLLENIKFFCYQSLHKNLNDQNYIFDELHHICSEKRLNELNHIHLFNLKRFIGLSATLTRIQKEEIGNVIGSFHVYKISLDDAISWGILPEPTIYLVGTELDNITINQTFHFNKIKSVDCTELDWYNYQSERIEHFKLKYYSVQQEWAKIKWLKSANDRKKFLATCKTKYAVKLLEYLKSKRLICFTGSIEQSEQLSNGLSIHSKISKKKREELLNKFNSGEIDKLFATGMLKEGQNLNNIQVGIIIQLDNVDRYFVQVTGRTLRAKFPEQYIMYVKNTQDEVYIEKVLNNINKDYVNYTDINQLTN